jgi:hypothetical protein
MPVYKTTITLPKQTTAPVRARCNRAVARRKQPSYIGFARVHHAYHPLPLHRIFFIFKFFSFNIYRNNLLAQKITKIDPAALMEGDKLTWQTAA